MRFHADFHVHSVLSPCALRDMTPRNIARHARRIGLNALAISDHNSARNHPAMEEACRVEGIACLFGIEVTTREEVHVICLFDRRDQAARIGKAAEEALEPLRDGSPSVQDQAVVGRDEDHSDFTGKYLGSPSSLPMDDLAALVHENGGLFVPAHFSRSFASLVSRFGHVPEGAPYDAIEFTTACLAPIGEAPREYPLLADSDAHALRDIGRCHNVFDAPSLTVETLRAQLRLGAVQYRIRE